MIKQDEYETVINHKNTYEFIAHYLVTHGNKHGYGPGIVFAWTDEEDTQLDILMAYKPLQYGKLQRGMNAKTDLFVAVSSFGMFGFELNGSEKAPGYVGEKLKLGGENATTIKLAELINAVCRELEKLTE